MKLNLWSSHRPFWMASMAIVAAATLGYLAFAAPVGSGYKLANKVTVGGDGLWDYLEVDSATHHVFISRGSHVTVLDANAKVIIPELDPARVRRRLQGEDDATQGLKLELHAAARMAASGSKVCFVSGLRLNEFSGALRGHDFHGTLIQNHAAGTARA